jgi:hypothetical protein
VEQANLILEANAVIAALFIGMMIIIKTLADKTMLME